MRDTVQRIIEANQYGRTLHAPSPKFRLLDISPICTLPFVTRSCNVYIEVIAVAGEYSGRINA